MTSPFLARAATSADLPLIARVEEMASTPPFPRSAWSALLERTGTTVRAFLEAMYAAGASRWGGVEDFVVLERGGRPVAACAVYAPEPPGWDRRALRMDRLPAVARSLGWCEARREAFREAYDAAWAGAEPFLEPPAPAVIESLGVLPHARGAGAGRALLDAATERARGLGAGAVGLSLIVGNERARRLYEAAGFERLLTVHAAAFGGGFPGLVKMRRPLGAAP